MSEPLSPVLIVDDEKDNLEALRRLLRNQYDVTITESPLEALKLVMKTEYHVIVSDQRMPEMTGVELLEKIKSITPNSTRVLLTGYTDIESVINAINRGNIYRYVAKPWDPEDLRLTLRQAAESYRLRKEIETKNVELSQSNAELTRALEDLRLLDRAKARFLQLVSHELNTPLTSVTAFISLLDDPKNGFSPEIQRAVTSLSSASDRLGDIVSEVLDYVRIESSNDWKRSAFDWEKETIAAAHSVEKERTKRQVGIELTVSPAAKAGSVGLCDAERTRVMLRRLLQDAILRSPEKKGVKISILVEESKLVYSVWREGPVISSDVFTPLVAAGEEMNHHRDLGLALAIVKAIADRQGASLSLDSNIAGGTTIAIRFE